MLEKNQINNEPRNLYRIRSRHFFLNWCTFSYSTQPLQEQIMACLCNTTLSRALKLILTVTKFDLTSQTTGEWPEGV